MAKRRHLLTAGMPYSIGGGGSVSGGSAGPVAYQDLVYYFDARSGVTTSGSAVTEWAPVVGSEAMVQATASWQPTLTTNPINGLAAVDFDGSDLVMGNTTKLGGASSWFETTIVVWSSGVTPTAAGGYHGLFGWANNANGGNGSWYHYGQGLMFGFLSGPNVQTIYSVTGDGAASPVLRYAFGTDPTQTATNVHVNANVFTAVGASGGPIMLESYTGSSGVVGLTTAIAPGSPANRTSSAMAAGCFADPTAPLRCLDGQLQAIYVWNRALSMPELARTMDRIAGTWNG